MLNIRIKKAHAMREMYFSIIETNKIIYISDVGCLTFL